MNDLNQLNIDNLTRLWKKMGVNNSSTNATNGLHISRSWPHRHWFDWDAQVTNTFNTVVQQLSNAAIVPVWTGAGASANQLESILQAKSFSISFSQLAMYLDLQSQQPYELPQQFNASLFDISKVHSNDDIETWTAIASAAFGYWIDVEVIKSIVTDPDITLLLVKRDGVAAATALVFKTGDVIGTHLVGVIADYRGQGIARVVMQQVINLSIKLGGKYLTLQASLVGEPLYRQLGFTSQFMIKNYKRM